MAAARYKVLFVCLGNICRSPAAEGVFHRMVERRGLSARFEVDSAGTYGGHAGDLPDRRMRDAASRRGLALTHRARRVTESDLDRFDVIVAMDDANRRDICRLAATLEQERKVVMMGDYLTPPADPRKPRYDYVPDPYYEGRQGFELVLDLLEDACGNLLDALCCAKRQH